MTEKSQKTCRAWAQLIGIACAVFAPQALAGAGAGSHPLLLRSGTVLTGDVPNLLAALRSGAPLDPELDYVLQLDGPMTPERRAALVSLDVRIGDYLPEFAYAVDLRDADLPALGNLTFVHWIGQRAPDWKMDSGIGHPGAPWQTDERRGLAEAGQLKLTVTLHSGADRAAVEAALTAAGAAIVRRYRNLADPLYDVVATPAQLEALAAIPAVRFIEDAPEVTLRNSSVRWIVQSNQVNATPLYANGLHGEGQVVGIIDGRINEQHCAFHDVVPIGPQHRKILAYNDALGYDPHGTHVAGTAVGDAGADNDTRGVAYAGRLVFSPLVNNNGLNDGATQQLLVRHHQQGARIHSNSWGNDATNAYDSLSRAVDAFAHAFEDDLVLFAVTNQSTLRNPENAKNVLAVGATGDAPEQHQHCLGGVGPTLDGRRKPEIYAPGCGVNSTSGDGASCGVASDSGTSMACPAMAGLAMLTRQYFTDGYYPTGAKIALDGLTPSGALLKATMLNSAVDLTAVAGYPSDLEGWGRVLADASLAFPQDARRLWITDVRNADGASTGQVIEYPIVVHSPAEKLKVTLTWTDPPAAPEAAAQSVNNLDLEVLAPGAALYRGNVFAGGASATGGPADAVNNVEQVHLVAPQAGTWIVRVRASAINVERQGFALVVTGDLTGPMPPLRLQLLDAVPSSVAPGTPFTVRVRVAPGAETLAPGSAVLRFRLDDDGPFTTTALSPLGGEVYEASVPAAACDEEIEFYISASGSAGSAAFLPASAPGDVYRVEVGNAVTTFADDFETNLGWSASGSAVDGHWERGIPANGNRGDPPYDADGSGQCYLTRNWAGNSDVDDGIAMLTSPVFDLSVGGVISYAYWLGDVTTGPLGVEDYLSVEIATDAAGTNWQEVRRYADALTAWRNDTIAVGGEVPASSTLRIRFLAADLPPGDVVEAAIDAFRVERMVCGPAGNGDFDGDGDLDLLDFAGVQGCFSASPPATACAPGDLNGDGVVGLADVAAFVSRLNGPLPARSAPPDDIVVDEETVDLELVDDDPADGALDNDGKSFTPAAGAPGPSDTVGAADSALLRTND